MTTATKSAKPSVEAVAAAAGFVAELPATTTKKATKTVTKVATGMIRVKLTARQMQAAAKADKAWLKANLTPVAKGKDGWMALDGTPAAIKGLYDLFTMLSTAKTSPIKMKLHMYAVCGAAARYLGDRLSGGTATVAVKASKFGQGKQGRAVKLAIELAKALSEIKADDMTDELKAALKAVCAR